MTKYDQWNRVKQEVNKKERSFYVKPREVLWIHLGENVGDEDNNKYYLKAKLNTRIDNSKIESGESAFEVNTRSAMLTHARLYDTKRGIEHIGYIDKEDFAKIKTAFKAIF